MLVKLAFTLLFKNTWRAWRDGAVIKVLTLHTQDPIWAPVLILAAPLPFQLPACGLGRQSRMAQGFGTLHPRGRPRRGSWLQIGIASTFALTWGVNYWTEDLPLCLSSLYIRLFNKKIIKINLLKKISKYFRWKHPVLECRAMQ